MMYYELSFAICHLRSLSRGATGGEPMNLYEVVLNGTESMYLLASTKYRALELVGDYFADAGQPDMVSKGKFVVRQLDLGEEQILRPERCRACPVNE